MSEAPVFGERRNERAKLRRRYRALRRALTPQQRLSAARRLARRLASAHWLRATDAVAAYAASDGEIDPLPFLRSRRRAFALPRIAGHALHFARASTSVVPGRYGIPAPPRGRHAWPRLDVLFVPLVAFDRDGHRLGRGGGYYDRLLEHRAGRPRPLCVGLAYAFQEYERLPVASWDVRLDVVVTPEATHVAPGANAPRRWAM